MIKKHVWEILLVVFFLMNNLYGKPQIIGSKVLSGDQFNASDIFSANLFIDKENDIVIEVEGPDCLWLNNKWVTTKQYGYFLNGFVKDGVVNLVFKPDEQHIDIYSVKKNIILEQHIPIGDFPTYPGPVQVIYVPGDTNGFYLLGSQEQFPRNPGEFMATVASGGHGIYYIKPVWAEIKGQTLLKRENVPYGGKADESYRVEKVLTGKDAIYLLGFRAQEQRSSGSGDKPPTPVISHYAEYDMNKKTLVRVQNVYENTPRYELGVTNEHINYFYGTVSADNRDDGNTVVVFSWIRDRFIYTGNAGIEDDVVQSQIYYAQCGKGKFNGVEKIGEGFIPLVKVDSLGNVHVIWVNNNGSLVHRAKKDGKWGDEEFFLNGVDNSKTKRFGKYICAEFDKDNNLNVVFLSNEQFVYAKIRAD